MRIFVLAMALILIVCSSPTKPQPTKPPPVPITKYQVTILVPDSCVRCVFTWCNPRTLNCLADSTRKQTGVYREQKIDSGYTIICWANITTRALLDTLVVVQDTIWKPE